MSTSRDIIRQITVLVSAILGIIGVAIGSGALGGTSTSEVAGGALSADATPIAPAGPAFSIWSVIYIGLIAYTIWQLLPKQRADERQRRLGYPIAASLLLNAAWLLSTQADLLFLSVPIIVVLLAVLVWTFRVCCAMPPRMVIEAILVDGTMGLYLGWVSIATAANIAAVLTASGFTGFGIGQDIWAVAVLAVAGAVGVLLAIYGKGRFAPTVALCWGLAWVAVGRLTGDLISVPAAVTAVVAIVVVVGVTVVRRAGARASAMARV
jgi:hypothetical protein